MITNNSKSPMKVQNDFSRDVEIISPSPITNNLFMKRSKSA